MWKLIPKTGRRSQNRSHKTYGSSHVKIFDKKGMRLNSAYPFV